MSETKPCDRHTWQPVLLPDGRTAILCGKCGQHALTLPADPTVGFLPPLPVPQPIWVVPYWQQFPPNPLFPTLPPWPYTITYGTTTVQTTNEPTYPYQSEGTCTGLTVPTTGWQQ